MNQPRPRFGLAIVAGCFGFLMTYSLSAPLFVSEILSQIHHGWHLGFAIAFGLVVAAIVLRQSE